MSSAASTSGVSTINFSDIIISSSSSSSSGSGARDGATGDGLTNPGTAIGAGSGMQAHLLEQLIGMQNAIESMESPMEQNEETMSVFMNMLEADAGLGGDFAELTFKSSP